MVGVLIFAFVPTPNGRPIKVSTTGRWEHQTPLRAATDARLALDDTSGVQWRLTAVGVILFPFDSEGGGMPAAIAVTRKGYTAAAVHCGAHEGRQSGTSDRRSRLFWMARRVGRRPLCAALSASMTRVSVCSFVESWRL
jgi:hypothetical protein